MKTSEVKRRMADNEAVFRKHNESINERLEELKRLGAEDKQLFKVNPDDTPLQFFCECSDENCLERVAMEPSRYDEIHRNRKAFVIKPGHEAGSIENIIEKNDGYYVAEKHVKPTEHPGHLKTTPVDNS